jgi:CO/xanthine dehydrogenase Mo-binding subunit
MDEIAAHVKADPVAYRLRHLRDTRLIAVVNAAAKAARWDARPSPRGRIRRTGTVTGRGFACVAMEAGAATNGHIAMVAEVEVSQDSGSVLVKQLFIAHECGAISNPNGLTNQLEGAALQGLSRALGEEVTWDREKITTVDWRSYRSMAVGTAMPRIETVLIDRPDQPPTGAGETGSAIVAAAIGNAIFDATGIRIRQLPFSPARLKQAISAGRAQPSRA